MEILEVYSEFGKLPLYIVFITIQFIPRLSTIFDNLLNSLIYGFDKDGAFLWISIHHIFQFILIILVMRIYFKSRLVDWGFNLDNRKYVIKIIGWFIIVLSVIELVIWMIIYINKGNIQQYIGFPFSFKNILSYYSFETFLSGTCEEPLFRGFAIIDGFFVGIALCNSPSENKMRPFFLL